MSEGMIKIKPMQYEDRILGETIKFVSGTSLNSILVGDRHLFFDKEGNFDGTGYDLKEIKKEAS